MDLKADGKILWNLLNSDYSMHIHRSPTEKFENIEKSSARHMSSPPTSATPTEHIPENTQPLRFEVDVMELQRAMISAIKELSYTVNTMVISSLATNDEERERIRNRVYQQEVDKR